jgi:hypothetical protein
MRLNTKLVILVCLALSEIPAYAQVKDMPSQAELDPILENADKKLKDFLDVLTEFGEEARALDGLRLDRNVKEIPEVRKFIRVMHSGSGEHQGVNMGRLVLVLSAVDDMAFDALIWKSLADIQMCKNMIQKDDPSRYDLFGLRVNTNAQMLREVGGQLFHPTVRMADATDAIMLAIGDAAKKN